MANMTNSAKIIRFKTGNQDVDFMIIIEDILKKTKLKGIVYNAEDGNTNICIWGNDDAIDNSLSLIKDKAKQKDIVLDLEIENLSVKTSPPPGVFILYSDTNISRKRGEILGMAIDIEDDIDMMIQKYFDPLEEMFFYHNILNYLPFKTKKDILEQIFKRITFDTTFNATRQLTEAIIHMISLARIIFQNDANTIDYELKELIYMPTIKKFIGNIERMININNMVKHNLNEGENLISSRPKIKNTDETITRTENIDDLLKRAKECYSLIKSEKTNILKRNPFKNLLLYGQRSILVEDCI